MLEIAINAAKIAGEEILKIYEKFDGKFELKDDNSPLTKADLIANEVITDMLSKFAPVLSEEKPVEYEIRKKWQEFWLVDPLDGTKDFIAKNGEFTINIALMRDNLPVIGVIYVPCLDEIYYAKSNFGAYLMKKGEKTQIFNHSKRTNLIGADSKFHSTSQTSEFYAKNSIVNIQKMGSATKFCALASGKIDVYARFNGTKEWDIAAADAILNESGCKMIDLVTKKPPVYNKTNLKNNFFIACKNDINFKEFA